MNSTTAFSTFKQNQFRLLRCADRNLGVAPYLPVMVRGLIETFSSLAHRSLPNRPGFGTGTEQDLALEGRHRLWQCFLVELIGSWENLSVCQDTTLPETNVAPGNQWLED